jgi:hypothetical protein
MLSDGIDSSSTIAEAASALAQYYEDQKIAKAEKASQNASNAAMSPDDTVNIDGISATRFMNLEQDMLRATAALPKNASFESIFSRALDLDTDVVKEISEIMEAMRESDRLREASITQEDFENSVDSMTTASGLRVDTVSSCKDRRVQAMVTVTRANGQSVSFEADDNVRINEREDGALSVTFAKTGEIRVYATDGSMTTEQGDPCEPGAHWGGTSGDDVMLVLRTGSRVGAGGGNDAVMILTNAREVYSGDGNDLIVGGAHSGATLQVDSGDGNDTLNGESFFCVNMGNGDNVMTLNSVGICGLATVGDGNNAITIKNLSRSKFIVGDGNNTIIIDKADHENINIGDGNNNILINSFIGHLAPGYDFNTLTVGNGDNIITLGEYINSPLKIGDGNNTITVGDFSGSDLQAGNGDNDFILRYISGWRPYNV